MTKIFNETYSITIKTSEFRQFQKLMYLTTGISLSDKKRALVNGRLKKRLDFLGFKSFRIYLDYINDPIHKDELQKCINLLTTNETFFFRHKNHWDFFIKEIISKKKSEDRMPKIFRVWSAAASTGEEAYSCAIACHNNFSNDYKIYIDATDVNIDVLNKAKIGEYSSYSVQKLTKICVQKYFNVGKEKDQFSVNSNIKELVTFGQHNLLKESYSKKFDVIFLRNVLIYFDSESKRKVITNITNSLKNGGYLFLGAAETLSHMKDEYMQIQPTIYRKINYAKR